VLIFIVKLIVENALLVWKQFMSNLEISRDAIAGFFA
jgi:hypothetical protein